MDVYHLIKLAIAFGGLGFSIGAFIVHYHHTQRTVQQNSQRITDLEKKHDSHDDTD